MTDHRPRPWSAALRMLAISTLLLGAVAAGQDGGDATARIRAAVARLQEDSGVPGISVAWVLPDGTTGHAVAGYADREAKRPMTKDTRLLAGSVGKTFVSATVLSLVHDGKLDLDDRISKWFAKKPWFERLPNAESITLRHLLQHRGGLKDHVDQKSFHDAVAKITDPDTVFTPEQLLEHILDEKPLCAAGREYHYTDTGYNLVGLIIEAATKKKYYDVLRDRVLEPNGLPGTVPADTRRIPGLAAGYTSETNNFLGFPPKLMHEGQMLIHPLNEWCGGGLASTPTDLARWAKRLYEGRALPAKYLETLVALPPHTPKDARSYYALGVGVNHRRPAGTTYGHSGWFPGYRTNMLYFVRHRIAVAAQINTDGNPPTSQAIKAVTDVLIGEKKKGD